MKKIIFLTLLVGCFFAQSQNTLPYSANRLCLDQIKAVSTNSPSTSRNMIVRDFDQDGLSDVMVADYNFGKIYIYKNNGNGTFTQSTAITVTGIGKFNSITVGRFNDDDKLDIAVSYSKTIGIFENLTGLTFTQTPSFEIMINEGYNDSPSYIKAQDLNNNNLDDIVLCSPHTFYGGYGIQVFRNEFTAPSLFYFDLNYQWFTFEGSPSLSSTNYMDFSFGDFDGDSKKDMLFTFSPQVDSVVFLKNLSAFNSNLSFNAISARSPTVITNFTVNCLANKMSDLNNDGFDDAVLLVSSGGGTNTVKAIVVIKGQGTISATPDLYQSIVTGVNNNVLPNNFDLADMNGDGFEDFIGMSNNKLWIYFWDPTPVAPTQTVGSFNTSSQTLIDLSANMIYSDEVLVGKFDDNSMPDIFFTPWRDGNSEINVIPNFSYSVSANSTNTNYCGAKTASMSIKINPAILTTHTVNWLIVANPSFTASGNTITTSTSGDYYPVLKFEFPYSAPATCSLSLSNSGSITISEIPGPSVSLSIPKPTVCPGDQATITAIGNGTMGGVNFIWSSAGGSLASATLINTITELQNYTVTGTDLSTGCSTSLTTFIDVFTLNADAISISKNPICLGDSTQLSLNNAPGSYTWSTSDNLSSIYVKPSSSKNYDLTYVDLNGCTIKKSTQVVVDGPCDIMIYSAITPNGDQINDVFTIDNIERFPSNRVVIFNRWGSVVFETTGYNNRNNAWPPKEKKIQPSTYFYVVDLGNGVEKIKGWVELLE
jgi:gliding motility-associated-like protein